MTQGTMVRKTTICLIVALTTACTAPAKRETYDAINAELDRATQTPAKPAAPDAVANALLPPLQIEVPRAPAQPLEERFSVTFNEVPARQFFMSIVSGTPYNMLVHPEVAGTVSANLKDVTVLEALDAIRELYGYDYRVEGNRITVRPAMLQTRVFQVNYLTGTRQGSSELRVTSTTVSDVSSAGTRPDSVNGQQTNTDGNQVRIARESSKVSTESDANFWSELRAALLAIVGQEQGGRSVVISPQSGVVVVRAMPEELRNVAAYLEATQLSVARQVILEAKILEVELNDTYQTGINWAAFRTHADSPLSIGMLTPGTVLSPLGANGAPSTFGSTGSTAFAGTPGRNLSSLTSTGSSLFGLAFQTSNFGALISFLESQGSVHVLSSPRIATLNNQKAVLKIGTDEFYVTSVSTTTTAAAGSAAITTPTITLTPFFSGVVLDVTPQIDEQGFIILHVRPSVSQVQTVTKTIDLGNIGEYRLPLAASSTSETDSIVRGRDGQIVAIGGLMRQATLADRSQVPGVGNAPGIGALFGNTNQISQKRELVILLKPTIVKDDTAWQQDLQDSRARIERLAPRPDPSRW